MDTIDATIYEVCRRVCEHFGIADMNKIFTPSKVNNIERLSDARSFAIYILHRDEKVTIPRLAAKFRRTPRTIYWHVRKVEDMMTWNEKDRKTYQELCK